MRCERDSLIIVICGSLLALSPDPVEKQTMNWARIKYVLAGLGRWWVCIDSRPMCRATEQIAATLHVLPRLDAALPANMHHATSSRDIRDGQIGSPVRWVGISYPLLHIAHGIMVRVAILSLIATCRGRIKPAIMLPASPHDRPCRTNS